MSVDQNNPFLTGKVIAVDKPLEWTSFDIVNKFRYRLCKQLHVKKFKVGHAGTLDPLATGLVLLCTGRSTKRIEELQADRKTYIATLKLGETTASHDLESVVEHSGSYDHVSPGILEEVLQEFIGSIEQVPPAFSACKIEGTRAYEMARRGEEVALRSKTVTIHAIRILAYNLPEVTLEIECGKGTYIRSLARDLGERLGCGAHLTSLRRTQIGQYTVYEAISPEEFDAYIAEVLDKYQAENEHNRAQGVVPTGGIIS